LKTSSCLFSHKIASSLTLLQNPTIPVLDAAADCYTQNIAYLTYIHENLKKGILLTLMSLTIYLFCLWETGKMIPG